MKKTLPIIYIFILIILDQIVKFVCLQKLKPINSVTIIPNFFNLTYVENRGAAFGMLEGGRWIFILIALIAVVFCSLYYKKVPKNKFEFLCKTGLILIISGALGNVIDRFFRGFVVDMLHFIFFGKDFAVFNVADVLVCLGTFLIAIVIIFSDNKKEKED